MTSFAEALKARTTIQPGNMTDVEVRTEEIAVQSTQATPQPISYQAAVQARSAPKEQSFLQDIADMFPGSTKQTQEAFQKAYSTVTGSGRMTPEQEQYGEFAFSDVTAGEDWEGTKRDVKTAVGMMVSANDEARKDIIKENFPDVKVYDEPTPSGEKITIAELPDGTKTFLNKPGLSGQDVSQFLGDLALFYGPAKVAQIGRVAKMGKAAKAATVGAAEAGTEAARQKGTQLLGSEQEVSPVEVGLAGLTGMATTAAPEIIRGFREGRQAKKAGAAVEDIAGIEKSIKQAEELTEKTGIPLYRAQKTGNLTDLGRQSFVASLPAGSTKAAKALEAQNKAAYDAVIDTMDKIAPVENIDTAAKELRKAAKRVITGKEKVRSSAAGRYYKEAFIDKTPVELNKTFDTIDKVKGKYEAGSKTYKLMERVEKLLGKGAEKAGDIQKRHNSKMEIDDIFKEFGDTGAAKTGKGELAKVKKIMIKELRDANPSYDEARKIFSQLSPNVQRVTEGKVGQLAKLDDNQLKTITAKLFDPTQQAVDPASIRRAKKLINDVDPEAWNDIVRTEFQKRLGKTTFDPAEVTAGENVPAQLYSKLFKGENGKTLFAALDGEAAKNARYLEQALKRAMKGRPGGSQTGERAVFEKELRGGGVIRGIKNFITRPVEKIGELGEDVVFDRNTRALADVMFDPKWAADMSTIRKAGTGSKAAETKMKRVLDRAFKDLGKPTAQAVRAKVTEE